MDRETEAPEFRLCETVGGRENRNQTARAIDQLQVGDEIPQLFHRVAIEQPFASMTASTSNSLRRKSPGHFLVLLEFRCVGTKQLAQRIVDLEPGDAKTGGDYKEEPRQKQRLRGNARRRGQYTRCRGRAYAALFWWFSQPALVFCRRVRFPSSPPEGDLPQTSLIADPDSMGSCYMMEFSKFLALHGFRHAYPD